MKPHHTPHHRIDISPFGVVLINHTSRILRDSSSNFYCIHTDGSFRRITPRFTNLTQPKRNKHRTLKRCIAAMTRGGFFTKGDAE